MFWGLIILNCTIKTRRIYFCAATKGIRPKISFTLVLLVHVPYPTFPQLSSFKSFGYLIFPFFAIIKLDIGKREITQNQKIDPSMTCPPAPSIRVLMVQLSIINMKNILSTFARNNLNHTCFDGTIKYHQPPTKFTHFMQKYP